MNIVVAGGTGLIGTALVQRLRDRGDTVTVLTRSSQPQAGEATWNPGAPLDPAVLNGVDAVVNLAGASIGKLPWTKKYRQLLRTSRVDATQTIVDAVRATKSVHLVNASAVGFYGSRGDETLTESSPAGTGVLADVTLAWEAAANELISSGSRSVHPLTLLRTGIVVAKKGALWPLRLLTAAGLGGRLGSGSQWWPWISLRDEVEAIVWVLDQRLTGVVNLVGPTPATQAEVSRALAKIMKRPYWFPAPAFALRLVLRQAADEVLLVSQKVRPDALLDSGFRFSDQTIESALRATE